MSDDDFRLPDAPTEKEISLFEEGLPVGTIAIWGVGLIGGSLGMAWRRSGVAREVVGIGRSEERLREAVSLGALDSYSLHPAEVLVRADVTVLCAPVQTICLQAEEYARFVRAGAVVTDVGSTKQSVVDAWDRQMVPGAAFVGGHPMAGSEKAGVAAARPDLYQGARYIITPGQTATPQAVALIAALARAAGAEVRRMSPEEHDQRVAFISHLPQMVAVALAAAAMDGQERLGDTLSLAAGGFRDTTRIASSPAALWQEILFSNQEPVRQALLSFREALDALEGAMEHADGAELARIFERAHQARQLLPPNGRR